MNTAAPIAPSTLLRRPAPATIVPCAPARPMRVRLTGVLLEDAVTSTEPATGRAAFTVTLAQGAGEPVVIATQWVGDGPEAAFHAAVCAQTLRAGDVVTVCGDGLRMRYRHGALALVVAIVRNVEPAQACEEQARASGAATNERTA